MIESILTPKTHVIRHLLFSVLADCGWSKKIYERYNTNKKIAYIRLTLLYCKGVVSLSYTKWWKCVHLQLR